MRVYVVVATDKYGVDKAPIVTLTEENAIREMKRLLISGLAIW